MIGNYLKTPIILHKAESVDTAGNVTYGERIFLKAKVERHTALNIGDGINEGNTLTVYIEELCPPNVLIQLDGIKHPSISVTNYYKFGEYAYTKVELQ